MRILANENFPGEVIRALRERRHDIIWIRTEAPGSKDQTILQRAQVEKRIIVTFDKDFGELAFHSRLPASCGIILFRISAPSPASVIQKVVETLESRSDWEGNFAVLEDLQIRMRPLGSK
jgi:predicted nuclease of predicted toxin-antitoxin system